ncbi:MAG TPA: hypothetical protein VK601_00370 [Kofleriaceae bacterium]|nr:hypothetical protein [Kofleriaceae bacterium]
MDRHARLPLALLFALALAPGCKSMGGVMSGVGKVAGGMAQAGPAIAKGVAQVGGALARTAPSVVAASESVLEAALSVPPEFEFGAVAPVRVSVNGDPCGACPLDAECGECVGYAGYACLASPAGDARQAYPA